MKKTFFLPRGLCEQTKPLGDATDREKEESVF